MIGSVIFSAILGKLYGPREKRTTSLTDTFESLSETLRDMLDSDDYWVHFTSDGWDLLDSPLAPKVVKKFDHYPTEEEISAALAMRGVTDGRDAT